MLINSIFKSIMGECNPWGQGTWTTFIRLQGCVAQCYYCDTIYAQDKKGGVELSIEEIAAKVEKFNLPHLLITGGEPLEQMEELSKLLAWKNIPSIVKEISIETNGLHDFSKMLQRCFIITDWKLPGQCKGVNLIIGSDDFRLKYFQKLSDKQFVKFVIDKIYDFDNAMQAVKLLRDVGCKAKMFFSPCELGAKTLYKQMKDINCAEMGIGLNLQIHKYIFDNVQEEEL